MLERLPVWNAGPMVRLTTKLYLGTWEISKLRIGSILENSDWIFLVRCAIRLVSWIMDIKNVKICVLLP